MAALKEYFFRVLDIHVSSIVCAAVVREISEHGLRRVADSIRSKGWLASALRRVVICKDFVLGELIKVSDAGELPHRV